MSIEYSNYLQSFDSMNGTGACAKYSKIKILNNLILKSYFNTRHACKHAAFEAFEKLSNDASLER